jgi:hypothetical protein
MSKKVDRFELIIIRNVILYDVEQDVSPQFNSGLVRWSSTVFPNEK